MSETKPSANVGPNTGRRSFLKTIAAGTILRDATGTATPSQQAPPAEDKSQVAQASARLSYPRTFSGRQLALLAFPLGGIGTGSISLGGRGQLRDWEIYNRPDKGRTPEYAFASVWLKGAKGTDARHQTKDRLLAPSGGALDTASVLRESAQTGDSKPIAHVLEAQLAPPYASTSGLGPENAPGLSRLQAARFTGEFPLAHIDFIDSRLPVRISLDAFSPFIPLDPENSGLPVAILRYRVRNIRSTRVTASISFSLENPVGPKTAGSVRRANSSKLNEFRGSSGDGLQGLYMTDPQLPGAHPEKGSFALCLLSAGSGHVTYLRGWPNAKWWASPMLFWDDFSDDGLLGPEAEDRKTIGSLCLQREIEPGSESEFVFLLSWHFPNRTPAWCGWAAPKGHENDLIGNYYCTRFADAWDAAQYAAKNLPELEKRTRSFVEAMRTSTLPGALRDAVTANLSTLVTQTCFRTADGEFHGFEGCNDQRGCCFGNCTHVWNYETATQFLFPSLARSLRRAAFGFSQDQQGGMRFRQMLPDGIDRFGYAAADGQMGQIIKAYIDWRQCGDTEWLRSLWPNIQKAVAFAWIPGGWDANRDGVMEGVQHNTYDVEFYGPNPLGGIYYLGGLRAAEEIAKVLGDSTAAQAYRALFEKGRNWIDGNLFNGEYYIQKIRSIPRNEIAPATVGDMGAEHPEQPEFQLGDGCLADQLIGQYLADIADLGSLVDRQHVRRTLESIHKYNYRRNLYDHDSVQRVYALNDEPAILVCDYGKGARPRIPFPYYAETWTGIEYLVATQFIVAGMLDEGLQTIANVRFRFDGERRNPWDEPECGHHYARAMSSWSTLVALSGFHYNGGENLLSLRPQRAAKRRLDLSDEKSPSAARALPAFSGEPPTSFFQSFWSTGSAWGIFSIRAQNGRTRLELSVTNGSLRLQSIRLRPTTSTSSSITLDGENLPHQASRGTDFTTLTLSQLITLVEGKKLFALY